MAVRAGDHGLRRGGGGPVSVGCAAGATASSGPAVAAVPDRAVPGRPGCHRDRDPEQHRRLRRRAVLGPHGAAPAAADGRAAAAGGRASRPHCCSTRAGTRYTPGSSGSCVPGSCRDHLAAVRRRAVRRGHGRHAPHRLHEPRGDQQRRARRRARALPDRRVPVLPAAHRAGADPVAGLLPDPDLPALLAMPVDTFTGLVLGSEGGNPFRGGRPAPGVAPALSPTCTSAAR